MLENLNDWLRIADQNLARIAAATLLPLGAYLLLSGLDDLAVDLCGLWRRFLRRHPVLPVAPPDQAIAVYVPLWQESEVIGPMLDHNLAAIDYPNYQVFVGVYQNDPATRQAVRQLEARYPAVHLAEVPHDGPTSKADCLNWIRQRMLLHEDEHGGRFDLIVIHDAEDLIHPRSFSRINRYSTAYDMIQVPVLALPTAFTEWTHGVYCDDFAESQGKDLETRAGLGGFLPGCGVGTAFRREALDRLAGANQNCIFNPTSLTEDYDNGLRMFRLGCRQVMLPLERDGGSFIATREYFPRQSDKAVRQRSRWVTGNALQSWERFGWGMGLPQLWTQRWFLWRDRKGVWGNPLSLLCNVILLYGVISWLASRLGHYEWPLRHLVHSTRGMLWLLTINATLLCARLSVRTVSVARIYGVLFALGVPLRMLWGNWINTRATLASLAVWARHRWYHEPLRWLKTEHCYPSREGLMGHKRRLGELLVAMGDCRRQDVDAAILSQPPGVLLGQHLIALGLITETRLYQVLSIQQCLPLAMIEPALVSTRIARSLPRKVMREWRVLPFRIEDGALDVASPRIPNDEMQSSLQRFTRLQLRFHLVTPSQLESLQRSLL
ncbi:glycosyl transferase family protein [uncultured Paludibaculum sp.]|uniref:glycosyl transferase family protein n=1 Tax=uncultured Paludibaculum sp. TaxID=1765020 RepID=UPI002AAA9B3D|nr:glycosyl transferase family protein [uncultured Paludibaculum sp.]